MGRLRLTLVTEPVYHVFRDHVFAVPKQAFLGGGVMLAIFVATLLVNRVRPRFWCRYLCPLGACWGYCRWRPLLRRAVEPGQLQPVRPVRHVLPGQRRPRPAKVESGRVLRLLPMQRLLHAAKPRLPLDLAVAQAAPAVERIDLSKRAMLRPRPSAAWSPSD